MASNTAVVAFKFRTLRRHRGSMRAANGGSKAFGLGMDLAKTDVDTDSNVTLSG